MLNVFVFIKGKLTPLDNTLPFLVALLTHHRESRVSLISSERNFLEIIKSEPFIGATIRKYGIDVLVPSESSNIWERRIGLLRLALRLTISIVTGRVIFINTSKLAKGRKILGIMMAVNKKLFGGMTVELNLVASSFWLEKFVKKVLFQYYHRDIKKTIGPACDIFVTSLPVAAYERINAARTLRVGYGRGFKSWIDEVESSLSNLDEEISDDFIFWPLSILTRQEKTRFIDLRPVILNTLEVMINSGLRSQIVFRYHPTTERECFLDILKKTRFTNYVISIAHPHQLIQKCRFVFSNTGTSLYSDAYFFNRPIIQYTPTQDAFCIPGGDGAPRASIFEPIVTNFFSKEADFSAFLRAIDSKPDLFRKCPGRPDDPDYTMIDYEAERALLTELLDDSRDARRGS